MGNSANTNLVTEISTAHKSILTSTNSILATTATLFTSANDFVILTNKIEKWSHELEKRQEDLLKKEAELDEREKKLDEREKGMKDREKGWKERERRVSESEKEWSDMQARMEANAEKLQSIVQLNVGGQRFEVPKATLLQHKGSYFETMITTEFPQIYNKYFFIDRNPKFLHEVLDYMRTKRITRAFAKNQAELREDFAFYNVPFPEISLAVLPDSIHKWFPKRLFSLLYKATRDGFGKDDFHRACDHKGATITIVQSEKGHMFGGYAPIAWGANAGRDAAHPDFCLFTLTNPHGIPPTQYMLKDKNDPSHYSKGLHVSFGAADLRIAEYCADQTADSHSFFGYSYQDTTGKGFATLAGSEKFKVKEIEVYLVI
eukprot:Phypoly_transcript_11196.p1 GENE.Phypoly_transcript_11196~~Phypoly_transcript_11196.p1  ORF type:complete len:401 (+),score=69.87 Phypoly_transcript_11196:80-1204(+)